ncbi:MAG: hypothetical protein IPM06_21385 [Rhizobiales bacterium]|nr:hypothetical protein [Hyphomicrobiales bacterium]
MTARVIIHPRCLHGPAAGALEAVLHAHGFATGELAVGPPGERGYCDLVRLIDKDGDTLTLERMDGHRFEHRINTDEPQVA